MGRANKGITERPSLQVRNGVVRSAPDRVVVEEPLEIRVAGESVSLTMRTPGDDDRLAVGFLFAEGILASIDDVGAVAYCGRQESGLNNVLDISPAPGAQLTLERIDTMRRGTLTTAACGVCGRKSIDDLLERLRPVPRSSLTVSAALLARTPTLLRSQQPNFGQTGGLHAAAALDVDGNVLAAFEDIGRHNAVDKVLGALLYARRLERGSKPEVAMLVVSGRASFEIVQKAAAARIPVVVSFSAASALAIDLAARAGITLCGFVRDGGLNVYSESARVAGLEPQSAAPGEGGRRGLTPSMDATAKDD